MYSKTVMIGKVCNPMTPKTLENGTLVGNFRLETEDGHKQYHTINCYDKTAHKAKDFQEGQLVFIEGKVNTRSYMDKNNEKKYVTTINASRLSPVGASDQTSEQEDDDEAPF